MMRAVINVYTEFESVDFMERGSKCDVSSHMHAHMRMHMRMHIYMITM